MRHTLLSLLASFVLLACDQSSTPATPNLPAGLVSRGPAQGPGVKEAKAAAKSGQPITLVGCIGGSVKPFVDGRAVFTIVDPAIPSCAAMGDDEHCKTPWDYCCEDRESLKRNIATVEIAGADGRPLAISVQGLEGLKPMATIAVTGTVEETNDAGLLVVRAKRIEVR